MPKILMPALSPTMESGNIAKWLVKEGDKVEIGDIIAEIETDKALMELESLYEGVIDKILIQEGSTEIRVNDEIANISGVDEAKLKKINEPIISDEKKDKSEPDTKSVKVSISEELSPKEVFRPPLSNFSKRLFASPLAKRLAEQKNIDLRKIKGSGPKGRIIKADLEVLNANDQSRLETGHITNNIAQGYKEILISPIRKITAQRMSQAKREIPHFYLRKKIRAEKLISSRLELNEHLIKESRISINDIIVKASAKALKDVPACNVKFENEKIFQGLHADISIAVALEDGLITPVIRSAEAKSLADISAESKDLIKRAREKKLKPEEYSGGCFSISNLGMMGIDNFDAIINPPQASILAVGRILKEPVVDQENQIRSCEMLSLNLSLDHRAIDGALGASFLERIAFYLENPLRLLN